MRQKSQPKMWENQKTRVSLLQSCCCSREFEELLHYIHGEGSTKTCCFENWTTHHMFLRISFLMLLYLVLCDTKWNSICFINVFLIWRHVTSSTNANHPTWSDHGDAQHMLQSQQCSHEWKFQRNVSIVVVLLNICVVLRLPVSIPTVAGQCFHICLFPSQQLPG